MAAKMIAFDQEARQAMQRGVAKLARAVKVTLGPRGRNVIIQKSFGSPTVTKDGVTVAKEIELEDKYENMGARMVKEVASKTSDVAGDGTTPATVLAEAIFNEGLRAVVSGVNPMLMKRGIEKAVEDVTDKLVSMSKKIGKTDEMENVATIAANNDRTIGAIIAKAMAKVGKDGVITVAVVVPSPATSEVLLATSLTIFAPMSSYLSSSSISLATVTPSLVTVGEPNDF